MKNSEPTAPSEGLAKPSSASNGSRAIPLGFPTGDDHYLGEGNAPTPYTAIQIRDACPPGRVNRFSITRPEGKFIHVQRFVETNEQGAKIQQLMGRRTSDDPKRNPPPQSTEIAATWADLQAHASYPADKTQITREQIRVRAGDYDCWKFSVEEGLTTTFYWFAVHLAGPPVRTEIFRGNELVLTMELTELTLN